MCMGYCLDIIPYSLAQIESDTMDYSGKEKEAMAIMAEADKKMKTSHSLFGSFLG